MYFDFPAKKLLALGGVLTLLLVAVFVTFEAKTTWFGESRFGQIAARTLSNSYRTVVYIIWKESMDGSLLASVGNIWTAEEGKANAIPVLTYHAIITSKDAENIDPESFEGHNVGLKEFEDQMFTLKKDGWETITLEEFSAYMNGTQELPEKSFLLTFDDGSKDSYYPVDPILKVLGYEAVTFILPRFSSDTGTYYYLSQNEIARAMESGRWGVESHGYDSHEFVPVDANGTVGASLANAKWLPEEKRAETQSEYHARVKGDLLRSKTELETMFERPIQAFAFPFGEFGQLSEHTPGAEEFLRNAVEDIYEFAFFQWSLGGGFTYNYPHDDTVMMKRISVHPTWSGSDLLSRMQNGMPKPLPFLDDFTTDRGWLSTWGDFTIEQSGLTLKAAPDASGASIILDGTRHWQDYTVEMEVESPKQTGVSVLVRFKDNENNAVCNLGNGYAHIEQLVLGEHRVIKGNRTGGITIPEGPFSITVTVEDRTISCAINGNVLVGTTFLDPSLLSGGIGIKVWDRELGKSALRMETISVTVPPDNETSS